MSQASYSSTDQLSSASTKFCKHCGGKINSQAVVCTLCGLQVEELKAANIQQPNIVINNSNVNTNNNRLGGSGYVGTPKSKWIALLLCFFTGYLGLHKFYEGKILRGILYLFTAGLLGVGIIFDLIILLFKSDPYYV